MRLFNPVVLPEPGPATTRINGKLLVIRRGNASPSIPASHVGIAGLISLLTTEVSYAVGDRVRVEVGFDARYRNGPQHGARCVSGSCPRVSGFGTTAARGR